MKPKLLFLTLNVFSATGGIEKVCRVAGKALHELALEAGGECAVYSMHDYDGCADEAYVPATGFKGFGGQKLKFAAAAIQQGRRSTHVLLSHINLLPVGYAIKKVSPRTKLMLMAHGIEVWETIGGFRKKMLQSVDLFLPVSSFTSVKLQTVHKMAVEKIRVLNNCLDPYLQNSRNVILENGLRKKYGIAAGDAVLLTVTRLKFSEQYKGYDKVVEALKTVRQTIPDFKYLIAGKWDVEEKKRLDAVIEKAGLNDSVVFAGFVPDEELAAHFNLADVYVMPSTGEGFGIVFIEALFYGLPVIAGNVDGSVDALAGGEFGLLVNPNDKNDIAKALQTVLTNGAAYEPDGSLLMQKFGFERYKKQLGFLLGQNTKCKNELV